MTNLIAFLKMLNEHQCDYDSEYEAIRAAMRHLTKDELEVIDLLQHHVIADILSEVK